MNLKKSSFLRHEVFSLLNQGQANMVGRIVFKDKQITI